MSLNDDRPRLFNSTRWGADHKIGSSVRGATEIPGPQRNDVALLFVPVSAIKIINPHLFQEEMRCGTEAWRKKRLICWHWAIR